MTLAHGRPSKVTVFFHAVPCSCPHVHVRLGLQLEWLHVQTKALNEDDLLDLGFWAALKCQIHVNSTLPYS